MSSLSASARAGSSVGAGMYGAYMSTACCIRAASCPIPGDAAVCFRVMPDVVVCCRVLQCVAVCCSVLQCVAVCCSMMQCVAVCCSVYRAHSSTVCCICAAFCLMRERGEGEEGGGSGVAYGCFRAGGRD